MRINKSRSQSINVVLLNSLVGSHPSCESSRMQHFRPTAAHCCLSAASVETPTASVLVGPHWGMRLEQVGPTLASGWTRTTPATPPRVALLRATTSALWKPSKNSASRLTCPSWRSYCLLARARTPSSTKSLRKFGFRCIVLSCLSPSHCRRVALAAACDLRCVHTLVRLTAHFRCLILLSASSSSSPPPPPSSCCCCCCCCAGTEQSGCSTSNTTPLCSRRHLLRPFGRSQLLP